MNKLFIGLLSTVILLSQNVAASPTVANQVKHLQRGAAIRVQMADGRILEGKLVSTSGPVFELLPPSQESAEPIECADVVAVHKISVPPKHRDGIVTALMVGGILAVTAVAMAVAGAVY